MKGVNLVILLGRVGQDPEMKTLQGGSTVTRFSIATSEVWVDKSGQKQEKTEWHKVVVWGKLAEVVKKYTEKGSVVHIQGKLSTRSWEDNGQKKYSTEVIASQVQFVSSKNNKANGKTEKAEEGDFNMSEFQDSETPEPSFNSSDDIPF